MNVDHIVPFLLHLVERCQSVSPRGRQPHRPARAATAASPAPDSMQRDLRAEAVPGQSPVVQGEANAAGAVLARLADAGVSGNADILALADAFAVPILSPTGFRRRLPGEEGADE